MQYSYKRQKAPEAVTKLEENLDQKESAKWSMNSLALNHRQCLKQKFFKHCLFHLVASSSHVDHMRRVHSTKKKPALALLYGFVLVLISPLWFSLA